MTALIEGDFSLNFVRGVLAAVNPCGFALLPTYLMFFLGLEGNRPGTQRAGVRRALIVSGCLSAGFFAVFLVIGVLFQSGFSWFVDQAAWLSIIIGALLLVFGIAMLFGFRLKLNTPKLDAGGRGTGGGQMFLYGMSYAIASIGCTIGLFIPAIASVSTAGVVSGVLVTVTYALGMALTVTALTVSLAFAKTALLGWMRRAMRHLDWISAVLLVLTGIYLMLYGWSSIKVSSNGVVSSVERIQNSVANWLYGRSVAWLVMVFGGITLAAVAFVLVRRDRSAVATGSIGPAD